MLPPHVLELVREYYTVCNKHDFLGTFQKYTYNSTLHLAPV